MEFPNGICIYFFRNTHTVEDIQFLDLICKTFDDGNFYEVKDEHHY